MRFVFAFDFNVVLCLGTKRLVKGIREAALSSILSVSTRAGGKRGGSRPAVVRETPTTRVNTSRDEAQLSIGPVVHVHRETNHGTGEILPRVTHRIGIEVVLGEVHPSFSSRGRSCRVGLFW